MNEARKNRPFDSVDVNSGEMKKQNIRRPSAGMSEYELEVKISGVLSAVINSDGVDLKRAINAGGLEVKLDTNGNASLKYNGGSQGLNLEGLDISGLNKDVFKSFNFGLKNNGSGGLDWSARVGRKGYYFKVKGSLDLNPMNGILGPSLRRMKATSAGDG